MPTNRPIRSPSAADLLIDLLAAHRLVRLVTADVITARPREAIVGWAYRHRGRFEDQVEVRPDGGWALWAEENPHDAPWLAGVLTCRWCAGVWIGAGVVVLRSVAPGPWGYLARALAASSAAGLLAALED